MDKGGRREQKGREKGGRREKIEEEDRREKK